MVLPTIKEIKEELSRKSLFEFSCHTFPKIAEDSNWFHETYYSIVERFYRGEIPRLIVSVPPQHGKLLPVNTPILTTKGWKNHGDLNVGDIVFGQDGKQKKVLGNSGSYDWNVEKISFNTGETILAAKEHLWKVNIDYDNKKGANEYLLETQEIFKRKPRRKPSVNCSPAIETNERNLPIDPYVLGCWLGDGNSRQGVLTVGKEDIEHFSKLGEAREVKDGIYRVLIEGLTTKLRKNNLLLNKHIPIDYLLSSKEQRLELLRGLLDTDGCVDVRGNAEFTQKSGTLSKDVYTLLRSLGVKARFKTYDAKLNGKIVGKKDRVLFNPSREDVFFKLDRKQQRITNKPTGDRGDKYKFFIDKIETFGIVKGNCIEVEGGMYLAGYEMIPTHNSECSSRRGIAWGLGLNPDKRVALVSYNHSFASKFNRDVQRIIDSDIYEGVFPNTKLNGKRVVASSSWLRNSEEFEIVNQKGGLKTIGVGGGLTGNSVDIAVMDDLYKDYQDATSPTVSERVWEWYTTVLKTRLHNESQELIVFTRWSENDLVGRLEEQGKVVTYTGKESIDEILERIEKDVFIKINFEGIKTGNPTQIDPRKDGEALWETKHGIEKLESTRRLDVTKFEALYQGNPKAKEGLLYEGFKTYSEIPQGTKFAYIDTADTGSDFLCCIVFCVVGGFCYVQDVVYDDRKNEVTEPIVADVLNRNKVNVCHVESNNGGRAFSRNIERISRDIGNGKTQFKPFTQTKNKQARILSNASNVMNHIMMPYDWETRFKKFSKDVLGYLAKGRNAHDDAPDTLTGVYEKGVKSTKVRMF